MSALRIHRLHINYAAEVKTSCKRNQLGTRYSQYILSILFIPSTCFEPLQVHHQEELLYLCETWYFLWLISNLMHKILVYLHIIHLLKSSTCLEHYPAHLQEIYVVIVYMQPLVSSLSAGDCLVHRLRKNLLIKPAGSNN